MMTIRVCSLLLLAVLPAFAFGESWADAYRPATKPGPRVNVEESRPRIGVEESGVDGRYSGTSPRAAESTGPARDFWQAIDKARREKRPVILWIQLRADQFPNVRGMPGAVHVEVRAGELADDRPRLALVTAVESPNQIGLYSLSVEELRNLSDPVSYLETEWSKVARNAHNGDYFALDGRKLSQTIQTPIRERSSVRRDLIAFPPTPQMPALGVPAPRPFPGSAGPGPAYDPDHNCDRCGTPEYVQSGPGPRPGSHTHTCRRCGNVWYH